MNDFTKEELQEIYDLLDSNYSEMKNNALLEKIQSMIDNYCEHEWENICCQCTLDKIYCHKCDGNMGNLKERYSNDNK